MGDYSWYVAYHDFGFLSEMLVSSNHPWAIPKSQFPLLTRYRGLLDPD
jgi:hypothetical protein